jgi:hypothetical protein
MSYSDVPSPKEVANLAARANDFQDLKDGSSPLIELSKALITLPEWSESQPRRSPAYPSPSVPEPPAELSNEQGKSVEFRLKNIFGFIRGLDLKSKPKKEVSEIYDEVHAAVANPVVERARSAPIPAGITFNNNVFNANAGAFASNSVPYTSDSNFYSNHFASASHPMIVAPIPRSATGCVVSTESLAAALQRRLSETEEDEPVTRRISGIRSSTSPKPVGEILNQFPSTNQKIEEWQRNGYDADNDDDEIITTDYDDVDSLADMESLGSVDSFADDANNSQGLCEHLRESELLVVADVPVLMVVPPDEEGRETYIWDETADEEERRGRGRARLISHSWDYLP